jgi:hypothetical protein
MTIGERLNRLDLSDGSVSVLQPPYAFRLLAISPDDTLMAYLNGPGLFAYSQQNQLIVRKLATAYSEGAEGQESILWQIPLDITWPTAVTEIGWSPDGRHVLVTATTADGICNKLSATAWELDVATGEFHEVSVTIFPTPTP